MDSEASLAAYLDSVDTVDEADRIEKRRQYAAQVRAHVTQLSAQEYWDQFPQSPEFVVAFLPDESLFSAALEYDPELLEFGVERRVILATPTTLIALLRAVAWGWKQELVSLNATEIRDLGKARYDQLHSLAGNLAEVQHGLHSATASFNRAIGPFESIVIPSARRLNELGASAGEDNFPPLQKTGTPSHTQQAPPHIDPASEQPRPSTAVLADHSVAALLSLHSALSNGDNVAMPPEFIPLQEIPEPAKTPVQTQF